MKIRELFKPKDSVTVLGAIFGFVAVLQILNNNLMRAAILMLTAAFCDWADGKVARKVGPTRYGHFLDMADLSSFGVGPALFIVVWLAPADLEIYTIATILFVASLLRLARFFTVENKLGMPVTVNGVLFPLLWLLDAPKALVLTFALVSAFLMISTFKFPRL